MSLFYPDPPYPPRGYYHMGTPPYPPRGYYHMGTPIQYGEWQWKIKRILPIKHWPRTAEDEVFIRTCFTEGKSPEDTAEAFLRFANS